MANITQLVRLYKWYAFEMFCFIVIVTIQTKKNLLVKLHVIIVRYVYVFTGLTQLLRDNIGKTKL